MPRCSSVEVLMPRPEAAGVADAMIEADIETVDDALATLHSI